jgi:ketosteroid isomerase-like protein
MIDSEPMRRALIAGAVVAVLIAGCGGGGSSGPQSARDAADAYVSARNSGDAAKICELYSRQLIQQLRTSNCVAFVQEQTSGTATDLTVIHVVQHGDHATATIQARVGGNIANAIAPIEIRLTRENGEWKVSGLGGPGG